MPRSEFPQQDRVEAAQERRERVRGYMFGDKPLSVKKICQVEGLTDRAARVIMKELEAEVGESYFSLHVREPTDDMPYGLSNATMRLRQRLGDQLYLLLQRGTESERIGRYRAAARIGLNNREQIRAEQRPFCHDWSLSQIERLAREHNRDPVEFLLSCLTS